MAKSFYDAAFGRILSDGIELELLGGMNFIGLTITANSEGYYDVTVPGIGDLAASDVANDSATASGTTVADALDGLRTDLDLVSSSGSAGAVQYSDGSGGFDGAANITTDGDAFIYGTGTAPTTGLHRAGFVNVAGGGIRFLKVIAEDGTSEVDLIGWNTEAGLFLLGANNSALTEVRASVAAGGKFAVRTGGTERWATSATGHDAKTLPISNVTTLNGATVVAPTEATLGNADGTQGIANGSQLVLPASTLTANRALTLSTGGSPITGETITIVRHDATAFTYAILNGGAGAGTLFTFPASVKGMITCKFDGTNWAWVGTFVRLQ